MKTTIALAAILCALLATASAAPFVNLDFEQATFAAAPPNGAPFDAAFPISAAAGLPGWTAQEDGSTLTALWSIMGLDETGVILAYSGTNPIWPQIPSVFPSVSPIVGNYGVQLYGYASSPPGFFKTASISQTGAIPAGVHSIQMLVRGNFSSDPNGGPQSNPLVTLNGTSIPMSILSVNGFVATFGGDITPFAGSTSTLTITAAGTAPSLNIHTSENLFDLDNISFSTAIVPEPSTLLLGTLGALALPVARLRRRPT